MIVTVPPPVVGRISFSPALPQERMRLQRNTYMGAVYKALAVFDTPFWRDRTDAEMITLAEPGCAVFDSSPPDGPGHLTLLVGGTDARQIGELSVSERSDLLLGRLAPYLGEEVRRPVGWHDKVWHDDPFVEGGYAALPIMGTSEGFYAVEHAPIGDLQLGRHRDRRRACRLHRGGHRVRSTGGG